MDVALSAHRGGVAELRRDLLDSLHQLSIRGSGMCSRQRLSQRRRARNGAGPGAKVFGGEALAGRLTNVVVHVCGIDGGGLTVVAQVLEELLSRQVSTAAHDPGN
jgi:hypothetical protein